MATRNVKGLSRYHTTSIKESTPVRSHINVMNVERPLPLFTVPATSEEPHW